MSSRITVKIVVSFIIVAVAVFLIWNYIFNRSQFPLPPDPGEAGKETLSGIDSDKDGVRDDLQRWIILNFDDPQQREALRVSVLGMQSALVATDEDAVKVAIDAAVRSSKCLTYDVITEAGARVLNTPARTSAYNAFKLKGKSSWINESRAKYKNCSI